MSKILYSHGGTRLVVPDETTHTLYVDERLAAAQVSPISEEDAQLLLGRIVGKIGAKRVIQHLASFAAGPEFQGTAHDQTGDFNFEIVRFETVEEEVL